MYNPYLVIPLAVWAITQVLKFTIKALGGRIDPRQFYASGGMPSVHSAVVCSLATTALLLDGFSSSIFGFTAVFAAIVMYDSLGVRRSSGEQSVAINTLYDALTRGKFKFDQPVSRLREVLGHKPAEVLVGAILGTVLAGLFNFDKLSAQTTWFQVGPGKAELIVYASIFAFLIVGSLIIRMVLRKKYSESKSIKSVTAAITVFGQCIGWAGLILSAFAYEQAGYLGWRLWEILILAIAIIWGALLFSRSLRRVPIELAQEDRIARKMQWLAPRKKSKTSKK